MRSSTWPDELRTRRRSCTGHSTTTCVVGRVLPRPHPEAHPVGSPSRSNSSTSYAWIDEVRAPVSSLALIHGAPISGSCDPLAPPGEGV